MAKKNKNKPAPPARPDPEATVKNAPQDVLATDPEAPKKMSIYDFKVQAWILAALAFIIYFNSFYNEYAHDDGIVIVKNEFVQEGFAGIPEIMTNDAYASYYRQLNTTNQLSGGRYRPLSIATFAIEQQFFGAVSPDSVQQLLSKNLSFGVKGKQQEKLVGDMHVRHVFNVLWYMLSVVVLLYFLRYVVFQNNPLMAFIAALIFTVHPIHTEVVANVKSRDEIMSLLFMCLTFIFEFKYREHKKIWMLGAAMLSYFLAFLSKEYAITMVVLLPLSLYLFNGASIKKSLIAFLPYLVVIAGYLAIRFSIVAPPSANSDTEVLNNPYTFAVGHEKIATEIATSLDYLRLLIWPNPLSADYSYASIPYKELSSPLVWLSLIVHVGMVVAAIVLLVTGFKTHEVNNSVLGLKQPATDQKRDVLSFAIAFYLLHLAMVCNIFFDIGATMGERLIYHSSVGFAIAAAYFLVRGFEKIKDISAAHKALAGLMVVIVVLCSFKTIDRNRAWKNDYTLFETDLKSEPNSVLILGNVAGAYITEADDPKIDSATRQKYLTDALHMLDHAITLHRKFVAGFLNRAITYYKLGMPDKAKADLDTAKYYYPNYPILHDVYRVIADDYMKKGWNQYGKVGKYPEAIDMFMKGIAIDSTNADLWYNLGGAYFSNKQFPEAIAAWNVSLRINPNNVQCQQGMQAAMAAEAAMKRDGK